MILSLQQAGFDRAADALRIYLVQQHSDPPDNGEQSRIKSSPQEALSDTHRLMQADSSTEDATLVDKSSTDIERDLKPFSQDNSLRNDYSPTAKTHIPPSKPDEAMESSDSIFGADDHLSSEAELADKTVGGHKESNGNDRDIQKDVKKDPSIRHIGAEVGKSLEKLETSEQSPLSKDLGYLYSVSFQKSGPPCIDSFL